MARRSIPESMSIALPDGREIDMAMRAPADAVAIDVRPQSQITPQYFESCPICSEPATTAEHIPPASLGGTAMTRTCDRCNNRLGSLVEPDLIDWVDGALTLTAFTGDAVRGPRYARRVLHRTSPIGEFALVLDVGQNEDISTLLASGSVQFTASMPDQNRVRLAALKHSYLSACVYGGAVPDDADSVRAELLAARDAADREAVPYGPIAAGLEGLRLDPASGTPPTDPLIYALARIDGDWIPGALLGGSTFVSWVSDPKPHPGSFRPRRWSANLEVGPKVSGTVTRVAPDPTGTRSETS